MSHSPLISIITIFLNVEKFIQEAIESVISQTYENWELLLVDDGSTDNSTAIAKKYAKQYPEKIHYLEHENHQNLGKSTSRNFGISNSKGEYIAFLDADDIYLPEKLARQVEILESHPKACMVYGPTQYWYSWTGNSQDNQRDFIAKLGVKPNVLYHPPTLLSLYLKDRGTVPSTCGLLVRRKVVEDIGGFERSIQHLYEDQVLLAKICLKEPVFVEGGCWDKYRQRHDSSWHISMYTGEDDRALFIFLSWLENYLSEHGFKGTELWQTLQRALLPYRYPRFYSLLRHIKYGIGRIKGLAKLIARRILPVFQEFTN
ncbi:hypothetical protein NUACC21_82440 [Scytonema sp. NUACC21]